MAIAETPDLQLPYPEPGTGEANNVPLHLKNLAEQIEAAAITAATYRAPEQHGALGDGVTDDTAAFVAAMAASKNVRCKPGKTYVVGDLAPTANATIDLNGAVLKRKPGARNIVKLATYRSVLFGGTLSGTGSGPVSTTASAAVAAATTLTVASAAGLAVGMKIFYQSAWVDGGVEVNEIASIVGTTVTLVFPLNGAVSANTRVLADFALLESGGAFTKYQTVRDVLLQDFLVGIQTGGEGTAASNSFTNFSGIAMTDFVGVGIYLGPNQAAEDYSNVRMNAGKTLLSNFIGDGTTTRFAIPYTLRKQVDRWGTEPTVRYYVGGVQQPTSAYTVDLATWEIVANIAPPNGANVQTLNYEYAAFGVVARQGVVLGPSSLERLSDGVLLAFRTGMWLDNCELGFVSNLQVDSCSYAALLITRGSRDIHFRGCDFLFSAFPVIIDGTCTNVSVATFSTTLTPDISELTTTPNKTEVTVRAGATNIVVDRDSWSSKHGRTASVATGTLALSPYRERKVVSARAFSNVAQALPNAATTLLSWELEQFDSASLHSTTVNPERLTVPAGMGGIWEIDVAVTFSASATGSQRSVNVMVNGVTHGAFSTFPLTAVTRVTGCLRLQLAAGDYITASAFNGGGGALTLVATFNESWLAASYLGPVT